jgi:hypothetical protein
MKRQAPATKYSFTEMWLFRLNRGGEGVLLGARLAFDSRALTVSRTPPVPLSAIGFCFDCRRCCCLLVLIYGISLLINYYFMVLTTEK